jgi:hypothetical protein
MLQRTPRFGMILTMLPARRAYPAHAGQPMAAAQRDFSPIAVPLQKRGRIHASVICSARLFRQPAPPLPGSATRITTLNRRAAALRQRAR